MISCPYYSSPIPNFWYVRLEHNVIFFSIYFTKIVLINLHFTINIQYLWSSNTGKTAFLGSSYLPNSLNIRVSCRAVSTPPPLLRSIQAKLQILSQYCIILFWEIGPKVLPKVLTPARIIVQVNSMCPCFSHEPIFGS